jgi:3D (Asp-Asp-Asp) domain-containing protein
MKVLIAVVGFVLLVLYQSFADEHSALARVTVYWHREGSGEHAAWNGTRLREGYCAIDPKRIPYGSKVIFPDAECVAVDSGPDVVTRKAARSCGRNATERKAIVIDRFFDTKQKALAWAKAHPHFMTVQVRTPGTKIVASKNPRPSRTNIASSIATSWLNDFHQGFASVIGALSAALTL